MHGIGLRTAHWQDFLGGHVADVDFVEVITENIAGRGGYARAVVDAVAANHAVVFHGVSMSLGGTDPLNISHIRDLRDLIAAYKPKWVTEHLCWSSMDGHYSHDLWPLPRTRASVARVVDRIAQVQDLLGIQIAVENISSYVQFADDAISEADFIVEILERADCKLLLDINNVVVNAFNHGFDAGAFVAAMPSARIAQLHLAGHSDCGTHLFDNHVGPVPASVWQLYETCLRAHGPKPTLIEWDEQVPTLERVVDESRHARRLQAGLLAREAA